MLHGHNPTNGPKGVHEQQAFAESELLVRESLRSLFPGSQSAPQAYVYAKMASTMVNVAWRIPVVSRPQLEFFRYRRLNI